MDDYLEEIIALRDERLDFLSCIDDGSEIIDDENWLDEEVVLDKDLEILLSENWNDVSPSYRI